MISLNTYIKCNTIIILIQHINNYIIWYIDCCDLFLDF